MKIGMRNVKTALSVFVCVTLYRVLSLGSPFYAAVASIISMQSSVKDSFKVGKDRLLGTFLGAVIGFLFALIAPQNPLLIGLGIVIIIYISNLLNWNNSISISGVVFISIMINLSAKTPLEYSFYRLLDTFIGISIAVLVNYFIVPPGSTDKISSGCKLLIEKNRNLVRESLCSQGLAEQSIRDDIQSIREQIMNLLDEIRPKKIKSPLLATAANTIALSDDIRSHLDVITTINGELALHRSNIKLLSETFQCTLIDNTEISNEVNIVYNYHVSNILRDMTSLEKLLNVL
jgi:uncharacterized membrane protein YgaE (UPF0421/DUF939 family)